MTRVYFVDDDENVVRSFRRILSPFSRSYEFTFATSAREALEHVEAEPPDYIFVDSKMPFMTGTELIVELKKRFPALVATLVTGEIIPSLYEDAPVDHLLAKPCTTDQIIAILEEGG